MKMVYLVIILEEVKWRDHEHTGYEVEEFEFVFSSSRLDNPPLHPHVHLILNVESKYFFRMLILFLRIDFTLAHVHS